MDVIATTRQAAQMLYQTAEPTKSQLNAVGEKCLNGTYKHAQRDGRRWLINMSREFPALFGEE